MTRYIELQESLGYSFGNELLLQQALTHPSYTAEQPRVDYDNQRLEFLGDAVLQLCVSDLLYRMHVEACEGHLSKMRSMLACEAGLAALARRLDVGRYIRLGRGDQKSGGAQRDSTLADAMEAVFGAVYLDGGFAAAHEVIDRLYSSSIGDLERLVLENNPKGALQEMAQEQSRSLPRYKILEVVGPDHEPEFTVEVSINDEPIATGTARNRREAEQEAARVALKKLAQ